MKKYISLALSVILVLTLCVGCQPQTSPTELSPSSPVETVTQSPTPETPEPTPEPTPSPTPETALTPTPEPTPDPSPPPAPPSPKPSPDPSPIQNNETVGQSNALQSAKDYLRFSSFSREGLIKQLEYEKFSREDAVYAVDNCGADWFEQAAKCAESYLDFSSFSRADLISQLEYEGFTHEQAVYGVEENGY